MGTNSSSYDRYGKVDMFKKKKHAKILLISGSLASRVKKLRKNLDLRIRSVNAQPTQHLGFHTRFFNFSALGRPGGANRGGRDRWTYRVPNRGMHIWLFVYKRGRPE